MIDPVPSRLLVPARVALSFRLAPVPPEDGLVVVEMVGLAVITTGFVAAGAVRGAVVGVTAEHRHPLVGAGHERRANPNGVVWGPLVLMLLTVSLWTAPVPFVAQVTPGANR